MNRRRAGAVALLLLMMSSWAWLSPREALAQLPGSLIVTITSPASGSTVTGTITVSASVSIAGTLTVEGVQFKLDGANLGAEDTTSPYSVPWNTTTASNGSHTLRAVARDSLGVLWSSGPITVTVSNGPPPDTTPPTVSMTAPASGSTVSGTISVAATASDNVGVAGVQFRLDGAALGAEDTTSPYAVSWNTTTSSNGSHTLTAVARDAAGNSTTSAAVIVTVANDTTRPTVTINQAAGQADPTSGAPINFTAVFSEPVSGFTGADVAISGTAGGAKTVTVSGGPSSYTVAVSGMTTGGTVIATIQAGAASDGAGNTNTASTSTDNTVTFTPPDTTPPTVSITAPTSGATVSGTISVTATASDNVGVTGVQFRLDGAALGAEDTASPYATSWNTATASNGSHTLTAVARDAAGNSTTSAAVTVTVSNGPPSDTTPPTVSITSPASGATVSGAITVSASASDNVGVLGVQFRLDGSSLGVEDTSSPYSTSWNTATATNGSHTLTAVARDAAGNSTTSAAVTVTVSNGPPSDTTPPTVSMTAPANGATVSGTISVTATASDNVGVAGVQFRLDGGALGVEDTASPYATSWNTTTASNGSHTLTAVARDAAGNQATSAAVTVTVSNGGSTVTRFEESAAVFTGAGWVARGPEIAAFSGGAARSSNIAGDAASFTFTGTAVSWIGLKCNVCGIASVSVDGGAATSVDTAGAAAPGSPGLASEVVYTASGLAAGSHTMAITVTGITTSGGAHIIVDAFDVTGSGGGSPPPATRIEDTDPAVGYTGAWIHITGDPRATAGSAAESNEAGARATLGFTGTGVSWITYRYDGAGIARVYLDGTLVGEVDTYSPIVQQQTVVFTASGLPPGAHTLAIEVTGRNNPSASAWWVLVDAFDVTP